MNKNQITHQAPTVRIGIIQSTDKVTFRCDQDFKICDPSNKNLVAGQTNQIYDLRVKSSQSAAILYQIRVAVNKDKSKAINKLESLIEQGLDAQIRIVGARIFFQDRIVDNRDYWVTIGNFKSTEEAAKFLKHSEFPADTIIVEQTTKKATGKIYLNKTNLGDRIKIIPLNQNSLISVDGVPIGISFHWQRQETLSYRGIIEIGFNNEGKLEVINELDIEDYLASVNSSEMTPDCPLALLEAQTIAARSTVLATMGKHHYNTDFHLCSDDHCQCYHGALREQSVSRQAVENSCGEILIYGDQVCDARYSKICGGIMESYDNVWEEHAVPYLTAGVDGDRTIDFPADTEEKARTFIDSNPRVFCNTSLHYLPQKLANLYSTKDLFRWQVVYDRTELEQLISKKLDIDLGELKDIKSLSRGASARLKYIQLVGSKQTIRIGKELEIRRVLSASHLYSSCFYVEKEMSKDGSVRRFILTGAGWGHGVGLCQVGATVMAQNGYSYQDILEHYYKNARLIKLY